MDLHHLKSPVLASYSVPSQEAAILLDYMGAIDLVDFPIPKPPLHVLTFSFIA
jgi:hypothetical protein